MSTFSLPLPTHTLSVNTPMGYFGFPPEIRNLIYKELLDFPKLKSIPAISRNGKDSANWLLTHPEDRCPSEVTAVIAFLRTNKIILIAMFRYYKWQPYDLELRVSAEDEKTSGSLKESGDVTNPTTTKQYHHFLTHKVHSYDTPHGWQTNCYVGNGTQHTAHPAGEGANKDNDDWVSTMLRARASP
ncbi:hypothetical protein B0H66DRAFT_604123 [Apodospora peruviana]|uniref:Uncharacterized protein n=1 Tax=Apodospora peruviana TaxID=516989 RepID=A0AAE0M1X8_9PEZI|nr:hypothetical protein B0H66DRAFT_604123 [Apodospora peruviana]